MMFRFGRVPFSIKSCISCKVEAIVDLMARYLMDVTIFIKVPSRRHEIRHRCRI